MGDSFQLSSSIMSFFQLTHMNVYAFEASGSMITLHAPHSIPDHLNKAAFNALIGVVHQQPTICHFCHHDQIVYMGCAYDSDTAVIAGPFLTQLPHEQTGSLNEHTLRNLPILNQAAQHSAASLLMHLKQMEAVPISSIEATESPSSDSKTREEEADHSIINLRYKINNDMIHAIETGDAESLEMLNNKTGNLFDFSSRFPNKPLRAIKNSLIILNTTFRLAAERGGVPPILLHYLSEKFAISIERINSVHSLNKLQETMGFEYCHLVRQNQLNGYSMLIKEAVRYFHSHFTEPFDAVELADELGVHPSHLARQFKKETGSTMSQFVHQLRIQKAKRLLKKDNASIEHITGKCGFEDAAYFIRVFKKFTGMPPGKWRSYGN
ncbi:helix-turn-helix domain-containing protein [Metabacillus halosaccharovorans]|uniref:helix-turn-helix domain-containing protein n=1 Tax=Metabacillus halosaccharovorans TaxID=930124 RepID=UPI0020410B6E|nr:AraC family transcriptional regulator [Metabacillus halosaccharovorans]MCM3439799.1 AraC family transcriptional regulator [Metabacillus halosaccharovorans]